MPGVLSKGGQTVHALADIPPAALDHVVAVDPLGVEGGIEVQVAGEAFQFLVGGLLPLDAEAEGVAVTGAEQAGLEPVEGGLEGGPGAVVEVLVGGVVEVFPRRLLGVVLIEVRGVQGQGVAAVARHVIAARVAEGLHRQDLVLADGLGPGGAEGVVGSALLLGGDGHGVLVDVAPVPAHVVVFGQELQGGRGRRGPGDLGQGHDLLIALGQLGARRVVILLGSFRRNKVPELVLDDGSPDADGGIPVLGGEDGLVRIRQVGVVGVDLGLPLGIRVVGGEAALHSIAAALDEAVDEAAHEAAELGVGPQASHLNLGEPVDVREDPDGAARGVADVDAVHHVGVLAGVATPGPVVVHAGREVHDPGDGALHGQGGQDLGAVVLGDSDGAGFRVGGGGDDLHGRAGDGRELPVARSGLA